MFTQNAKDNYYLTLSDLAPLTHQLKRNPVRRSAPQRLYKKQVSKASICLHTQPSCALRSDFLLVFIYVQDVIELADKKLGGLEGFQQTQTKRRLATAKRQDNKDAKYAASDEGKAEQALIAAAPCREQALQASLAKHGLELE